VSPDAVPVPAPPTVRLLSPGPQELLRSHRAHWARRRRLERQLHDGASLRISALALRIGVMRHRIAQASPDLDETIDELQEQLHAVLQELRDVAGRIYPTLLDEAGLGPALREAADRSEAVVRVVAPDGRFDPAAEGAAYFALAEVLSGLGGEHRDVTVTITAQDAALVVAVDNVPVDAGGQMLDEVAGLGGTIDVTGGTGVGTILARIPCA
jgi:signal transduction histidine kinase